MAGVSSGDEHVFTSPAQGVDTQAACRGSADEPRHRHPGCAFVVRAFQDTIDEVVALAVFMTIVASMGGNAATQTLDHHRSRASHWASSLGATRGRRCSRKRSSVWGTASLPSDVVGAGVAWLSGRQPLFSGLILALAMVINLAWWRRLPLP